MQTHSETLDREARDEVVAEYRYARFTTRLLLNDLRFGTHAPRPGDPFPDFDLATVDGPLLRSAELLGQPFVLVLGSLTCPMTASAARGLRDLFETYREDVRFVSLYTREAHPGATIPQPGDLKAKTEHARQLAERDRYAWTVAVDDLAGSLHRQLDGKPNAAFVVDRQGRLVFRTIWSSDHRALRSGLDAVVRGDTPAKHTSRAMVGPMMRALPWIDRTISQAGRGATRDLWRAGAPLAAMAKLGRLLPRRN